MQKLILLSIFCLLTISAEAQNEEVIIFDFQKKWVPQDILQSNLAVVVVQSKLGPLSACPKEVTDFSAACDQLHRGMLKMGLKTKLFVSSDVLYDEKCQEAFHEQLRENEIDYILSYVIIPDFFVKEFQPTDQAVTKTTLDVTDPNVSYILDLAAYNGELLMYNQFEKAMRFHQNSFGELLKDVQKVMKKNKVVADSPLSYFEPEMIDLSFVVEAGVSGSLPEQFSQSKIHIEKAVKKKLPKKESRPPGVNGASMYTTFEQINAAVDATNKATEELLNSMDLNWEFYVPWDLPIRSSDYLVKSLQLTKKQRKELLDEEDTSEMTEDFEFFTYYFLKNAVSNKVYAPDYGDYNDQMESRQKFFEYLRAH